MRTLEVSEMTRPQLEAPELHKWHTRERLAAQIVAIMEADWSRPSPKDMEEILKSAVWAIESKVALASEGL
jgi:hypothetical protein